MRQPPRGLGMNGSISAPFIRFPIGTSLLMAGILFIGLVSYPGYLSRRCRRSTFRSWNEKCFDPIVLDGFQIFSVDR